MDLFREINLKKKIQKYLEDYHLDEGNFFMIRNRKQEEIENNVSNEEVRRREREEFSLNPEL